MCSVYAPKTGCKTRRDFRMRSFTGWLKEGVGWLVLFLQCHAFCKKHSESWLLASSVRKWKFCWAHLLRETSLHQLPELIRCVSSAGGSLPCSMCCLWAVVFLKSTLGGVSLCFILLHSHCFSASLLSLLVVKTTAKPLVVVYFIIDKCIKNTLETWQ